MSQTKAVSKSSLLFEEALQVLPGGFSRNTIARKPHPDYAAYASGSRITDMDGRVRIDFASNMASLIHGHAFRPMIEAVTEQLERGTAFTMATEAELRHAQHLCSRNGGFEKIRFMNSGTEAVMAGIKAARAVTGKPKLAKSEGAYHGTYDYAEVSQTSKPANWGDVSDPNRNAVVEGTPRGVLDDVVVFPFNDIERTIAILDRQRQELACVLIDPLPHRAGLVPATPEFMSAIRTWTRDNHVLLLMDEVITFRMNYGGAQEWYPGLEPDLTSMGKIIGGGFPVGALAGKNQYMSVLDPTRDRLPFPISGTFSANPITMTAGRIAMEFYDRAAVEKLNQLGDYARQQMAHAIEASGFPASVTGAGSMFRIHFKKVAPVGYRSAYQDANESKQMTFLVDYLYEHGFIMINTCSAALSTVLTKSDVDQLAAKVEAGLVELKRQ
jgi:glutamate-1-semialdehyde 2,1-aminomutase